MTYRLIVFELLFFCTVFFLQPAFAAESTGAPILYKSVFGLLLHDRGPASDLNESGIDPHWELQLHPPDWKVWRWIGGPYPMVGVTPNFNGDTSVFYAGITYELSLSNQITDALTRDVTKSLFVAGGISAALHDGPLHKNRLACRERSDCGFGYRVLPRLNIELGTNFWENHGISVFYDHMSHKGILAGENEGIDHIGIRYHYKFKAQP
jgi:hypothetical protein